MAISRGIKVVPESKSFVGIRRAVLPFSALCSALFMHCESTNPDVVC